MFHNLVLKPISGPFQYCHWLSQSAGKTFHPFLYHWRMLLELERSLLLPLEGLELGLFFLEFSRILSKSVLECLLLVEGVVLVLEVL